jgi:hypothetical protein
MTVPQWDGCMSNSSSVVAGLSASVEKDNAASGELVLSVSGPGGT